MPAEPRASGFGHFSLSLLAAVALLGVSCAGGGGGGSASTGSGSSGGGSGTAASDFAISVSPNPLLIVAGNTTVATVSVSGVNGFSSSVNVQTNGLPATVSASPTNVSVTPGTSSQITLTATANAGASSSTLTFVGTSASRTHNAPSNLSVYSNLSKAPPSRTRYVRTDATTEYFVNLNQHWAIYHAGTKRFFVTDPWSNRISVLDATTETLAGNITVPGAWSIDDTPDHNTLYVGTLLGDVYTIDATTLAVTHRYIASQIGPYGGYPALSALVMADGRVALLGEQGGIASVDGSDNIAIWNPVDNSINIYGAPPNGAPASPSCLSDHIGGFARTTDRTRVWLGGITSAGLLCRLDPASGQYEFLGAEGNPARITTSPDGNYIAFPANAPNYNQVVLYDAHTLNKVAQFGVNGTTSSDHGLFFSADSKTLYVPSSTIVYAYDVTTHQQIGWTANLVVMATSGGGAVGPIDNPYFLACDDTGLCFGPAEEGVGFVDLSSLQTGAVTTQFLNGYLNPAAGPAGGGTQTKWDMPAPGNGSGSVYLGGQKAPLNSYQAGFMTVTTAPGVPGPVDVYFVGNDGSRQVLPDAFSYGPSILQVTPDIATTDGNAVGFVFGYGLVPVDATSLPPHTDVSVGGAPATILGFSRNAYGLLSPPFPLQLIAYVIPPGANGSADVKVSNNWGTATAPGALTYMPRPQQFSLPGAALVQGIYDPHRDVYYFTDASKVQVFSRTLNGWLAPINIPAPSGAAQRLWGISLSPDGSKLAIADALANVIYVLNPSNPGAIQTYPFAPSNSGGTTNPVGIAISDGGIAYIAALAQGATDGSYYRLDTGSGTLTSYHIFGPQRYEDGVPLDVYLRLAISSDGARVYFNNQGTVFSLDTATGQFFLASTGYGCCFGDYELSLSSNQTRLEASSYSYDSDLNAEAPLTANIRELITATYVYGAKLSPDGTLLFQPSFSGIDVFDGRTGTLRTRLALPFLMSPNYDALVSNGKDNVLLAITGNNGDGIAVVDLTSFLEPSPLPYFRKAPLQTQNLRPPMLQRSTVLVTGSDLLQQAAPSPAQGRSIQHVARAPLFPR